MSSRKFKLKPPKYAILKNPLQSPNRIFVVHMGKPVIHAEVISDKNLKIKLVPIFSENSAENEKFLNRMGKFYNQYLKWEEKNQR